ncbi:MAG TPA: hypothetical protein VF116_20000 [Ktedonobacterales bacterium]
MGTLRIMSRQGDTPVTWDEVAARAGDPEAVAAVEEAERIFAAARANGATAFVARGVGQAPVRIDRLDREAREIILVPRVIGG